MDKEIELKNYLLKALRFKRLLAAGAMIGIIAGAVATMLMPPIYSSDATVNVSITSNETTNGFRPSEGLYHDLLSSERMGKTYIQLLSSRGFLDKVAAQVGMPGEGDELEESLSATSIKETQLIVITAEDKDPRMAADIANAAARVMANSAGAAAPGVAPSSASIATHEGGKITVKVVEAAGATQDPVSPKPARNLALGLIGGLFFAGLIALLRDRRDTRVTGLDDLGSLAEGIPVLAATPARASHSLPDGGAQDAGLSQALSSLQDKMRFLNYRKNLKTIVVCKPSAGSEGSDGAVILGTALARGGSKVLLIDADLRAPGLAGVLGADAAQGLSDVLVGSINLKSAATGTAVGNLSLLSAGTQPPNPTELLTSESMADLMVDAAKRHDYVIVNAPALDAAPETRAMAERSDGLILSFEDRVSERTFVQESLGVAAGSSSKLLGLVLTGVNPPRFTRSLTGAISGAFLGVGIAVTGIMVAAVTVLR